MCMTSYFKHNVRKKDMQLIKDDCRLNIFVLLAQPKEIEIHGFDISTICDMAIMWWMQLWKGAWLMLFWQYQYRGILKASCGQQNFCWKRNKIWTINQHIYAIMEKQIETHYF